MPYLNDVAGVYKLVNKANGLCYVGQSLCMKKRIHEHMRLLRLGKHTNPRLQNAYNKHGADNFEWSFEAFCEDPEDMDTIENAFISGDAFFSEPVFYNIADFAKAPMRGKKHTEETKRRVSESKKGRREHVTPEYRERLRQAQHRRVFSNPEFVAKVSFLIENPHMSYAERARKVGIDTSSARRLALKYKHLRGNL